MLCTRICHHICSRRIRTRSNFHGLGLQKNAEVKGEYSTSNALRKRFQQPALLLEVNKSKKATVHQVQSMAGASQAHRQNRLALEKSPYLLQHAANPVDWFPWGEEAFSKAQEEKKLIFLSVGYSTCHWCHVMEHESFECERIAAVMNEHFINIKVDREERPDVDKIYMSFVQASSGRGGWPMSIILTPDLKPIAGGTYFPPEDRWGSPGFKTFLDSVSEKWQKSPELLQESGTKIVDLLRRQAQLGTTSGGSAANISATKVSKKCFLQLKQNYEEEYGGFGHAPKFPQPVNFNFLMWIYSSSPASAEGKESLEMTLHTLRKMAMGGIHDHVSQGFARYSTDVEWHVPHFEKMLYDQAQLVVSYTKAYLASKDVLLADTVRDILSYVSRDLSDKSGGFYSAEDADSYPTHDSTKKKEGAFCVWRYDDVQSLLNEPLEGHESVTLADVVCRHYNIKEGGNVNPHKDPHSELKNQNVLIAKTSEEETAEQLQLDVFVVKECLQRGRQILYDARQKRPRPHLDDKMLTAWNGLMISGFAKAGAALEDETYIVRAIQAARFLRQHMFHVDTGTLLRSCYRGLDGQVVQLPAPIQGFVDDYAFVICALLDLYEACCDPQWVEWAAQLQQKQDELFWDSEKYGYFSSSVGDKSIVIRMKEDQDGAEPASNSVSVQNLQRLATFLDKPEYRTQAGHILAAFQSRLLSIPMALPEMVCGLMMYHHSPKQIVVVGSPHEPGVRALLRVVQTHLLPNKVLIVADGNRDSILYQRLAILSSIKKAEKAEAHVCTDHTCSLPVDTPEALKELIMKN